MSSANAFVLPVHTLLCTHLWLQQHHQDHTSVVGFINESNEGSREPDLLWVEYTIGGHLPAQKTSIPDAAKIRKNLENQEKGSGYTRPELPRTIYSLATVALIIAIIILVYYSKIIKILVTSNIYYLLSYIISHLVPLIVYYRN